ncbi:MAG: YgjP-like metallopeptidase domain-containing protein [Methylophilaceae bacterium]
MTIALKYIQHYPQGLQDQIRQLYVEGKLADYLQKRYPQTHTIQTSKALYHYCSEIKQTYLSNVSALAKVEYDSRLTIQHHALGLNTAISRLHGGKLKAKKEIRISDTFKTMPEAFLRMIVVHELAHLKEREHNKSFYKLCEHMEPDYHQLEFDCRVYLTWKEASS